MGFSSGEWVEKLVDSSSESAKGVKHMTTLREAINSNHNLRRGILLGLSLTFIVGLAIFATMFLIAVVSVG